MVEGWLARPNVAVTDPTGRHLALVREMVMPFGTAGDLTTDAHVAALAREHGAELWSTDRDFARLPGVDWHDPLG